MQKYMKNSYNPILKWTKAYKRSISTGKMLDIISHQGNANLEQNEILLYPHQVEIKSDNSGVGEDVEKLEPSHIAGRDVKCIAIWKTVFLTELLYDLAIPHVGLY